MPGGNNDQIERDRRDSAHAVGHGLRTRLPDGHAKWRLLRLGRRLWHGANCSGVRLAEPGVGHVTELWLFDAKLRLCTSSYGYAAPNYGYAAPNYGYASPAYSQPSYRPPVTNNYYSTTASQPQTRYVPVSTPAQPPRSNWGRRDSDHDGIPNRVDHRPYTPADRDHDGIPNRVDRHPNTPKVADRGSPRDNGRNP